jgi:hypothetical protein
MAKFVSPIFFVFGVALGCREMSRRWAPWKIDQSKEEGNVGTLDSWGQSDLKRSIYRSCATKTMLTKRPKLIDRWNSAIVSKNQLIDDLNIQNSAEQIDLNNKFRRDKPDESDTKMIRIKVIQSGFGPIFHSDQTYKKINQSLSRLDLLHELQNRSLRISKQNQRYWCPPTGDLFPVYILNSKIQHPLHWCTPLWLYSFSRPPYYLTYKQNENIEIK